MTTSEGSDFCGGEDDHDIAFIGGGSKLGRDPGSRVVVWFQGVGEQSN